MVGRRCCYGVSRRLAMVIITSSAAGRWRLALSSFVTCDMLQGGTFVDDTRMDTRSWNFPLFLTTKDKAMQAAPAKLFRCTRFHPLQANRSLAHSLCKQQASSIYIWLRSCNDSIKHEIAVLITSYCLCRNKCSREDF